MVVNGRIWVKVGQIGEKGSLLNDRFASNSTEIVGKRQGT